MSESDLVFNTMRKVAMSILIKYRKKPMDDNSYDSQEYSDVLALYMLGKLSRYGLTTYFEQQWYWNRLFDTLLLVEILEEADKFNPVYDRMVNERAR